ncbi:D-alanyl-D-alanine carboxypeptidase family protein [Candidatus Gracilibacteria bacterium]|nr:D-alanyl-D-alanine carboxypeptidase family protein [Candidatus Gracilibacteria bacterium]
MNSKKYIPFFTFFLLIVIGIISYYKIFIDINYTYLNFPQRYITKNIADKWETKINSLEDRKRNIIKFEELENELNFFEKLFINKIFSIPAGNLGFKGKYYGLKMPTNIIEIPSKIFDVTPGQQKIYQTGIQYYTKHALDDFNKMLIQIKKDINKEIWIESGYRSPGNQAYQFFKYLADTEIGNNFSLYENAKWVAMPGYSEHGSDTNTAFDFILNGGDKNYEKDDGTKMGSEEFALILEKTEEFKWLVKNASKYNFYLSYPRDNKDGINYEPWHWHWEKK